MKDEFGDRLTNTEMRLNDHDKRIAELETDMGEIRTYLGTVSTKADIAELRTYVGTSINSILRDALNAVPGRQAAIWCAVAAVATVGMLVVALLHL